MRTRSLDRRAPALLALVLVASLVTAMSPLGGTANASILGDLTTRIVTFDHPPTAADLEMLEGFGGSVHGYQHIPAAAVVLGLADVDLLAHLPGVRGVFENTSMEPLLQSSTRTIRANVAWDDLGWTGDGISIAVIDTGIDGTHPDLCAAQEFCLDTPIQTIRNLKFIGRQTVADPVITIEEMVTTDTSSGHGTHVAGIAGGAGVGSLVGADYRGVAPGANLIGLAAGEAIEAVNVLAAYDWAIEHAEAYNIRAINNSWGPGKGTPYDPGHPVNLASDAAHAAGISVVFGAGNDGPTTDTLNMFSVHDTALSVAGGINTGHIAFFSSRGVPGSDRWQPTITAPGYMIAAARSSTGFYSALAGVLGPSPDQVATEDEARYVVSSGTSMAAPHIAGVVALMQQAAFESRGVHLAPDEVRAILQHTAVRDDSTRGPGGRPNYQAYTMGAGYVDAAAAAAAAAAGSHTTPWDPGTVTQVQTFHGTAGPAALIPTQTFDDTIEVQDGAISLNVMAEWAVAANDIDLDLYRPDGTLALSTFLRCNPDGEPNGYSSFCSQIANERLTVVAPVPGTWRVVVKGGLASTVEDVTGLWSVEYPDTVTVSNPEAAAITLDAGLATTVTGVPLEITATVRDADGNPVPSASLTWTSSGVGTVTFAESETRAHGWAKGEVVSGAPGVQTLTVTSGAVSATVDIVHLGIELPDLTPASTPGQAHGGGWLDAPGGRVNLAVNVEYAAGGSSPSGHLVLHDRRDGTHVSFDRVDRLVVNGSTATVTGRALVNGNGPYTFTLTINDGGPPSAGSDTFDLTVTGGLLNLTTIYAVSGTMGGGNLVVRAD
jgi:serine protease AprX